MVGFVAGSGGGTRENVKGYACSTLAGGGGRMSSAYAGASATLALVAALASLLFASTASIEPGVLADEAGGIVRQVDAGGYAWQAGIRPGQRVILVVRSEEPGGWALETSDGTHNYRVSIAAGEARLRWAALASLAATLIAVVSLAAVRTRRRRAELLASFALVLAVAPYAVVGLVPLGTATVLAAGLVPVGWLLRWTEASARAKRALGLGAIGLGAAWTVQQATSASVAVLPEAWWGVVAVGTLVMLGVGTNMTPARVLRTVAAIRVLDGAVVAAAGVVSIGLYAAGQPVALALLVVLVALVLYVRARAAIEELLDRMLLAEIRERTAFQAAEQERARMSREIHDSPLQTIAGVIQQLERAPETSEARESLRSVAAQLRSVATDLHPPVLDDLGLVPAIEAVARQANATLETVVALDNQTGYTVDARPPADVELAVYRIVQEALTNAVHHSQGRRVEITGLVSPSLIALDITDDGIGLSSERVEAAMRDGHLGVASMRRRAAAIDARLDHIAEKGGGTRVKLRWTK